MEFKDKVAVVTGGASGIGRSIALALAKLGTDIVVADIHDTRMEEVCREIEGIGRRVLSIHCDVSKDSDVNNLAARSIAAMGKVDILINNAGVAMRYAIEEMTMDEWHAILGINLLGPVRGVLAFLPHMLERSSGYIINTASAAGFVAGEPQPFASNNIAYSTSKFGVVGFTEGLFGSLYSRGITVSLLCPGWVATNIGFNTNYLKDEKKRDEMKREWEEMLKTPGYQEPDDVARIVIEAMKEKRFLILTSPDIEAHLTSRGQDMHKLEKHLQEIIKT